MAGGHSLNIKQGPGPRRRHHPERIRSGQQFFPRSGGSRQRFTVGRFDGEWVSVDREDGRKGRVSLGRLLASDAEGNGIHFRFHGFKRLPRGYRTNFEVVSAVASSCRIVLPEWDPAVEIEVPLAPFPVTTRFLGAQGSCRADLSSTSIGGLELHGFSPAKTKGLSRTADPAHPHLLAVGQEYRRRSDGRRFRLLSVDPALPTVSSWSGRRVVHLDVSRLLATAPGAGGLHYAYLGGGVTDTRRRRSAARIRA